MVDHSAIDSVELSEVSACERNNMVGARTTPSDALQIPTCSGSMESPYSSEVSGGSSRPHYSIPAEEPFSRHRGSGPTERWMDATQSGTEGNLVLSPLVTCSVSESEALKRRTEEYISESGGTNTLRSRPMAEFAYPDAFGGEVLETSLLTEDHYQCGEVNVALVDINDVDHDVLDQLERYSSVVNSSLMRSGGKSPRLHRDEVVFESRGTHLADFTYAEAAKRAPSPSEFIREGTPTSADASLTHRSALLSPRSLQIEFVKVGVPSNVDASSRQPLPFF